MLFLDREGDDAGQYGPGIPAMWASRSGPPCRSGSFRRAVCWTAGRGIARVRRRSTEPSISVVQQSRPAPRGRRSGRERACSDPMPPPRTRPAVPGARLMPIGTATPVGRGRRPGDPRGHRFSPRPCDRTVLSSTLCCVPWLIDDAVVHQRAAEDVAAGAHDRDRQVLVAGEGAGACRAPSVCLCRRRNSARPRLPSTPFEMLRRLPQLAWKWSTSSRANEPARERMSRARLERAEPLGCDEGAEDCAQKDAPKASTAASTARSSSLAELPLTRCRDQDAVPLQRHTTGEDDHSAAGQRVIAVELGAGAGPRVPTRGSACGRRGRVSLVLGQPHADEVGAVHAREGHQLSPLSTTATDIATRMAASTLDRRDHARATASVPRLGRRRPTPAVDDLRLAATSVMAAAGPTGTRSA